MRNQHVRFGRGAGLLALATCLWASALVAGPVLADEPMPITTLPGDPITVSVRNLQRKADLAFERGDYARAHRVYLRKLAPKGDKHAHYMIGHLNEHGLGVPRDEARALAWYALSAERGSVPARALATEVSERLDEAERERADEIFAELQGRYGDKTLTIRAVRRDMRELRGRTGSYLGSGKSPMRVLTAFGQVPADRYYDALEARIQYRMQLLGGNVTLGDLELIDAPAEAAGDPAGGMTGEWIEEATGELTGEAAREATDEMPGELPDELPDELSEEGDGDPDQP